VADLVMNISLGKVKYYWELPAAADGIIVVPLEATGIQADATIRDHDFLDVLLAASNNEQTTMGRKTITTGITITVDDANERLDIDCADQVWAAATGNAVSDLLFCYDPDTGAGTDATVVPLHLHDFAVTPDGSDITAQIAATGIFRAQ
jgi:hypothetical protein